MNKPLLEIEGEREREQGGSVKVSYWVEIERAIVCV
jgi:hypothetical protein